PLRELRGEICDFCAEHRDEAPREEREQDLLEMILRRGCRIGCLQPCLLPQDRAVQLLELSTWFDPELLDQDPATVLVCLESFGLPPRPVQRKHVVGTQTLAHRMLVDQSLELADQLAVT